MTYKKAIVFCTIGAVFYAVVLTFIYPLVNLIISAAQKFGLNLRGLEGASDKSSIDIAYILLIFLLIFFLDILARYKKKTSLFKFLFGKSFNQRQMSEDVFRLAVFISTFIIVPLMTVAFLQRTNLFSDRSFHTSFFDRLFVEDGPMEWLTCIVFAGAGIVFFRAQIVIRGLANQKSAWLGWFICGLALASIFVAGEEISWGQRLFGWSTPDVIESYNTQSETNLHNIFSSYLDNLTESTFHIRYYFIIGAIVFFVSWFGCLQVLVRKENTFRFLPHASFVFLAAEISIFALHYITQELVEEVAGIYMVLLAWDFLRQAKDLNRQENSVNLAGASPTAADGSILPEPRGLYRPSLDHPVYISDLQERQVKHLFASEH